MVAEEQSEWGVVLPESLVAIPEPSRMVHHYFAPEVGRDKRLRMALVAGDALHNLRSALDHLAWELAERYGSGGDDQTAFPILAKEPNKGWSAYAARRLGGATHSGVLSLLERYQPYRRDPRAPTDELLWILHRLNIVDKHHTVRPAVHLPDRGWAQASCMLDDLTLTGVSKIETNHSMIEGAPVLTVWTPGPARAVNLHLDIPIPVGLHLGGATATGTYMRVPLTLYQIVDEVTHVIAEAEPLF